MVISSHFMLPSGAKSPFEFTGGKLCLDFANTVNNRTSDHPEELPDVVGPIIEGRADLVIGSRTLKKQPAGALLPQAILGNRLACFLMRVLFRH